MDITEAFRQEDISKTDFFDFVVSPDITDSQLQLSKQMRSVNVFFETDLAENSSSSTSKEQNNNLCNIENTQPLAGFDQLWSGGGDSKENNRLESAILEDLSRYCWSQPQDSMPSVGASGNTDGQIYTLTVLNGTALEPWARTKDEQPAPLDIESILGLPGFAVKTETFSYEDSGFADNKEDINEHFQNNNNDWRLADHNASADSLLRSALQGKGYAKVKQEEDLRRALVIPTETILFPVIAPANDQDSLGFVDSNIPLFEEEPPPAQVDDIFLSHLDSVSYPDDYEKLKRIATEVQQFCVETYAQPAEVTSSVTTKPAGAKKYRRGGTGKPTNTATSSSTTSCSNGTGAGARKERSLHYCSICSKGFKDKYSVNVHIRTHTGEKPFACSLCGKSFRQKAHLAKHYQTHLAQKHAVPGVSKVTKR